MLVYLWMTFRIPAVEKQWFKPQQFTWFHWLIEAGTDIQKHLLLLFLFPFCATLHGYFVNTRCKRIREAFWNCVWYANDCGTLLTEHVELCDGVYGGRWHEDQVGWSWAILWGTDTILRSWIDFGYRISAQLWHYSQVGSFSCFCAQLSLQWFTASLHTVCSEYIRSSVKCV